MPTGWHPEEDPTPTPRDVEFMAAVLEGRHGWLAADVADFYAIYHSQHGDTGRSGRRLLTGLDRSRASLNRGLFLPNREPPAKSARSHRDAAAVSRPNPTRRASHR